MGKKKGGKKGGKGKKGKGSAKSIKSAISDSNGGKEKELDANSKEFWQRQVDDLDRQVDDYQKTCDLLEVNNVEKVNRLEQLGEEKEDIHSFLANSLAQKTAELHELTKKLFELQQAKDAERESFESQLAALEEEYQDTKAALSREQENLSNKLGSMKEYEIQRADLMAKFAKIDEELERQLHEHQKIIYDLEREMVVDKDRLRKEASEKVTNLATEFRKVSDKQMEDTRKRALRENVQLNKNLQRCSDKTVALIEENDAYKYRAKQNHILVEMLEFSEKELSRKFNKNVQQIRIMLDKSKGMEGLTQEYENQTKDFEVAIEEHKQTIVNVQSVQKRHSDAQNANCELKERIKQLKKSNETEAKTRNKLQHLLLDTAKTIKMSLPPEESTTTSDSPNHEEYHSSVAAQREVLLHHLMRLLNSAANMGVGPQAGEFQVEKPALYTTLKSQSTIDANASGLRNKPKKPMEYKGGILGIVPLPPLDSKRGSSATEFNSRPGSISATRRTSQQGGSQGKQPLLMRSIACQTVSVPKAVFMAKRKVDAGDTNETLEPIQPGFQAPLRV